MVKYYGYLVADEWLYQRAASRDVRTETGVYTYTKFRQVKTLKGKIFWCIAFAASDPWDGLPTSAPPEERYKPLKEALQKKGPPRWFRAS
ncbi:uncharacterized protein BJ212DRAFT_249968 [Suillus subaureus]|uniref:Uncharacterized protein n=1 Tax=Suillus subaureus TaxID=48587 RepID=A0A9P7JCU8_9AGAM|nr:uncharacterized protein BJ212DRAFT_249968 [Suillus subaureus]KAG1815007.1 hypothetical protein BJ212DRAFT_249968 [Suillus subaureus]